MGTCPLFRVQRAKLLSGSALYAASQESLETSWPRRWQERGRARSRSSAAGAHHQRVQREGSPVQHLRLQRLVCCEPIARLSIARPLQDCLETSWNRSWQERRRAPEHATGAEKCARARSSGSGEMRQSTQQERRRAPEHAAVGAEKSARARRSGSTPPEGAPVRRTRASNSHAPSSSNSWRVSGNACGACGSTGATPGAAAAVGTGTGISVVSRSTAARCSFWPGCACCSPLEACMRCPTMFVRRLQQSLSSANGAAT